MTEHLSASFPQPLPEMRITAMPDIPAGVEQAQIGSSSYEYIDRSDYEN